MADARVEALVEFDDRLWPDAPVELLPGDESTSVPDEKRQGGRWLRWKPDGRAVPP